MCRASPANGAAGISSKEEILTIFFRKNETNITLLPSPLPLSPECCRWSDKWKRDALKLMLFEAALGQRDFGAALQALRPVTLRWPSSPLVWNGFSR